MAEPKIFTKNYINGDDEFSITHGASSRGKLYDRDMDSKYFSSAANSDATTVTIEVEFKEGGTAINRTIDYLMIHKHNLKAWRFYTWNGSSYDLIHSETNDTTDTYAASFSKDTVSKIKIEMDSTQTADQEKQIGELIVAELKYSASDPDDFTVYNQIWKEPAKVLQMIDGAVQKVYERFSPNRVLKYEARFEFRFISDATMTTLKAIVDEAVPVLLQPESSQRKNDVFYVHIIEYRMNYADFNKGAGYRLSFRVREV